MDLPLLQNENEVLGKCYGKGSLNARSSGTVRTKQQAKKKWLIWFKIKGVEDPRTGKEPTHGRWPPRGGAMVGWCGHWHQWGKFKSIGWDGIRGLNCCRLIQQWMTRENLYVKCHLVLYFSLRKKLLSYEQAYERGGAVVKLRTYLRTKWCYAHVMTRNFRSEIVLWEFKNFLSATNASWPRT